MNQYIYHCSLRSAANNRNKQFAEVHFHCILAPTMYNSLANDRLYVVFQDSTLGGWQERRYLMKGVR